MRGKKSSRKVNSMRIKNYRNVSRKSSNRKSISRKSSNRKSSNRKSSNRKSRKNLFGGGDKPTKENIEVLLDNLYKKLRSKILGRATNPKQTEEQKFAADVDELYIICKNKDNYNYKYQSKFENNIINIQTIFIILLLCFCEKLNNFFSDNTDKVSSEYTYLQILDLGLSNFNSDTEIKSYLLTLFIDTEPTSTIYRGALSDLFKKTIEIQLFNSTMESGIGSVKKTIREIEEYLKNKYTKTDSQNNEKFIEYIVDDIIKKINGINKT